MTHPPAVIFGAFDRHNFGDLLIARVVARLLPRRELWFAGLGACDLRAEGGFATRTLQQIADAAHGCEIDVIHSGGEVLTCDAWEAAVMLAPPSRAASLIRDELAWLRDPAAWARAHLGMDSLAPYVLARAAVPGLRVRRLAFNAVGGAGFDMRDGALQTALRAEVLAALQSADRLSVRDRLTQSQLDAHGIAARLAPDPAVMTKALFDSTIQRHAARAPLHELRDSFAHGYAAVQFSVDFADDATLDTLAHELQRMVREHGIGIVLFRAGAAPWHDDLAGYERVAARLPPGSVRVFESLNVWDICALIAHARVACGSSLHARIVAMSYAIARVTFAHDESFGMPGKHSAYLSTWEGEGVPSAVVRTAALADTVAQAMNVDRDALRSRALSLTQRYRHEFEALRAALD